MDFEELILKVNELKLNPWLPSKPAVITIYFDEELKVKPMEAQLEAKQEVYIEALNVDVQVTLPQQVLAESDGNIPQQAGSAKGFKILQGESRLLYAYDLDVELSYLVTFEPKPGEIEGIHRPPVIIIKTVDI